MENNALKVVFWNARGITNKLIEFTKFIYDHELDIICVCESFLKNDKTIYIRGYKTVVENRVSRFGGLLILINEKLRFSRIQTPPTKLIENLGIKLHPNQNGVPLHLILIYLPGQSTDQDIRDHFKKDLIALGSKYKKFYMMGDFNARNTNWNCATNNRAGLILQQYINSSTNFLVAPADHTHCPVTETMRPSTIDLLVTDGVLNQSTLRTLNELNSDHLPVYFKIYDKTNIHKAKLTPCFRLANWKVFRQTMNRELGPLSDSLNSTNTEDIDLLIEKFNKSINKASSDSIPTQRTNKDNIEIDSELKALIRNRNYHRRRFNRNHNLNDKNIYQSLNHTIKERVNELKFISWSNSLSSCSSRNNVHHRIIRQRRHNPKSPSMDENNIKLFTDQQKADELAKTFMKAHKNSLHNDNESFTKNINHKVNEFIHDNRSSNPIYVHTIEIDSFIREMKNKKSPGPDEISNQLVRNLSCKGKEYLCNIINSCLTHNYFPAAWKTAIVIAIPKPGKDHKYANGYRPISLLSVLAKIFERILKKRILDHMNVHEILPDEQFGFRTNHSTTLQLVRVHNYIYRNLSTQKSIGLVALDIEKAFDSVWHNGLLCKMIQFEFPRSLILIINSFLVNRSFNVRVGNDMSASCSFTYGVPQGSVLSPILYNIFTADIPKDNKCEIALYADDTAIYTSSKLSNCITNRLSKYFFKIKKYFHKWKIKINVEKTQAIFFTNRRKKQLPSETITLDGRQITWTNTLIYLGFLFDNKLTHTDHITNTLRKTDIIIKCIYPLIARDTTMDPRLKLIIYKTYIRPVLTYACPLTLTASRTQLKRLQIKQNKILKLIMNKKYDYSTKELHLESAIPLLDKYMQILTNKIMTKAGTSKNQIIQDISKINC